ncbi:DegV family protein [Bacillus solimangrovi]|uniref:DegV family protein n=1 Tax=Bacillus solimangrovi TaxID=1305675 RepID=UPI001C309C53|nr:DegV family protein [Bacillus solimangrovi]
MKKVAWITDSSAYVPEKERTHKDLYIVPMNISFGNKIYKDGIDISPDELYVKMDEMKDIPKTSQPALSDFIDLYTKLKHDYDEAIAVHISGNLSGTYNVSNLAAKLTNFPVEVIDSRILSYPITMMINKGMKLHSNGMEAKEIADILRKEHTKYHNYILVGKLEQLYKGGRINGIQKMIGSLLNIHPILQINNGNVEIYKKSRTKNKAINTILEQFYIEKQKHTIKTVQVLHADAIDEAKSIRDKLVRQYDDIDVLIGPISQTIGVHGGKGSLTMIWKVD